VVDIRTAHTAELDAATLREIRTMLEDAFAGDFDDADWDHSLGGVHAIVSEDGRVIGHGSVVQRRLLHAGRAWRTGYVEAVGVRPDRRGRGHATAMMTELERVLRGAYELGALSSSHGVERLYRARGWLPWQGPTAVLTPTGIERTPDDDGSTHVFPIVTAPALNLTAPLTCDWRDGDVW
jgi:aminoglycoside 2'-N-acetyltransferase I